MSELTEMMKAQFPHFKVESILLSQNLWKLEAELEHKVEEIVNNLEHSLYGLSEEALITELSKKYKEIPSKIIEKKIQIAKR